MIQAKRQVKGRIAPPGALGIQKHRPQRTIEDVFRTHITMHQGLLVGLGLRDQGHQPWRAVGMTGRGGCQVGLQPDRIKNVIGREALRQRRISRAA